jgi:hypothetical protein
MGVPRISAAGGLAEGFSPQPTSVSAATANALVNRKS